ncbi:hypothetical protein M426DRAFT_206670 [Hypoxylon sp. CI-4A]|nr:hypothetical protein M426DRAFT_206670 [Hypoxylon sp. CI-4A]
MPLNAKNRARQTLSARIAEWFLDNERLELAIMCSEKASSLDLEDYKALFSLLKINLIEGYDDEARKLLERLRAPGDQQGLDVYGQVMRYLRPDAKHDKLFVKFLALNDGNEMRSIISSKI